MRFLVIAVLMLTLSGCAGDGEKTAAEPRQKATEPHKPKYTMAPKAPEKEAPNPDGTFTHSCDYVLEDFSDYTPSGYRFVADAKITNTGNVGLLSEVKAIWFQAGGKRIVETKRVKIPVDKTKRVGITRQVGGDEISLIQALEGDNCKVVVSMIDTY